MEPVNELHDGQADELGKYKSYEQEKEKEQEYISFDDLRQQEKIKDVRARLNQFYKCKSQTSQGSDHDPCSNQSKSLS